MAEATYEASLKIGTYKDKDGKVKDKNIRIGTTYLSDKGNLFIKMDVTALNPTLALLNARADEQAGRTVFVSLFKIRDREGAPVSRPPVAGEEDDDIPF